MVHQRRSSTTRAGTSRCSTAVGKITSVEFLKVSVVNHFIGYMQHAPVSIGHWSLLRLSARTEALRPSLKKGPRSAIFIQWECSSQTRLHSLPSSVRVHSSFDRSFQPQSSICDAEIGIKELGFLGRSLNRRKCNSITGQPQQRYKWECYGINRVVSL
jgi:hypothetical protein